jgi:hypothetical protein
MRALALILGLVALTSAIASPVPASFKRPDCSAYSAAQKPERKCVREIRRIWQEANFAALQKAGLMFAYMARPDAKTRPDALKVVENRIEGSFAIRFAVKPDGTVYDVQILEVTQGIQPLASLWADTIRQWTFAKTGQAVTGIEYRRIYMYAPEDDDQPGHQQHDEH